MFSRKLKDAERRYSKTEREMLAIIETVQHHRHLIEYATFDVYTDHAPLTAIKSVKDSTGRMTRWLLKLSPTGAKIKFIAGSNNVLADALSRFYEQSVPLLKTVVDSRLVNAFKHVKTNSDFPADSIDGISSTLKIMKRLILKWKFFNLITIVY